MEALALHRLDAHLGTAGSVVLMMYYETGLLRHRHSVIVACPRQWHCRQQGRRRRRRREPWRATLAPLGGSGTASEDESGGAQPQRRPQQQPYR